MGYCALTAFLDKIEHRRADGGSLELPVEDLVRAMAAYHAAQGVEMTEVMILDVLRMMEIAEERLMTCIAELETALQPFVRHGSALGAFDGDEGSFQFYTDTGYREIPAEDFIRARAALQIFVHPEASQEAREAGEGPDATHNLKLNFAAVRAAE